MEHVANYSKKAEMSERNIRSAAGKHKDRTMKQSFRIGIIPANLMRVENAMPCGNELLNLYNGNAGVKEADSVVMEKSVSYAGGGIFNEVLLVLERCVGIHKSETSISSGIKMNALWKRTIERNTFV